MCKSYIGYISACLIVLSGCATVPDEPVMESEAEWSNIYEKGFCVEWQVSKKPVRRCHMINEELVCRDEEDLIAKCLEW